MPPKLASLYLCVCFCLSPPLCVFFLQFSTSEFSPVRGQGQAGVTGGKRISLPQFHPKSQAWMSLARRSHLFILSPITGGWKPLVMYLPLGARRELASCTHRNSKWGWGDSWGKRGALAQGTRNCLLQAPSWHYQLMHSDLLSSLWPQPLFFPRPPPLELWSWIDLWQWPSPASPRKNRQNSLERYTFPRRTKERQEFGPVLDSSDETRNSSFWIFSHCVVLPRHPLSIKALIPQLSGELPVWKLIAGSPQGNAFGPVELLHVRQATMWVGQRAVTGLQGSGLLGPAQNT